MRFTTAVLALSTIIGRHGGRAEGEGEYFEEGVVEILEGEGEEPEEPPPTTTTTTTTSTTVATSAEAEEFLYYPDWNWNSDGCLNDGNEPVWMKPYLFSSLEECCEAAFYYEPAFTKCLGEVSPPDLPVGKYFPAYDDDTCLEQGTEKMIAPAHMYSEYVKDWWFVDTLQECCERHFSWKVNMCMGELAPSASPSDAAAAIQGFFPDWLGPSTRCLEAGVDGTPPPYMIPHFIADTLRDCCEEYMNWDIRGCTGATAVGTNKWYVVYGSQSEETCLQDCRTDSGNQYCGGLVPEWQAENGLYDTQQKCCEKKLPWISKETCILNSRSG